MSPTFVANVSLCQGPAGCLPRTRLPTAAFRLHAHLPSPRTNALEMHITHAYKEVPPFDVDKIAPEERKQDSAKV